MTQHVITQTVNAATSDCFAVPFDATLPGTVLLRDPIRLMGVLSSSLSMWLGAHAHLRDISIDIYRYKPGRRCLFELKLILSSPVADLKEHRIIGKIYANNRGAEVYETLGRLWLHGFATGSFKVPEPLAYDPEWRLLLMTRAQGESLDRLLLSQLDPSQAIIGSAEWLLKLHTCGVSEGRYYDFNKWLHKLGQWQRHLELIYPEAELLFAEILSRIKMQSRILSDWPSAPSHHDCSPEHLIINDAQITGVDFDEFRQYDPLFDVAHFVAHLQYLGLTHFGALNHFCWVAKLFQDTYKAQVKDYCVRRVHLYLVIVYLKLVHVNAFNRQAKDWKQTVDILLHEAQQIV